MKDENTGEVESSLGQQNIIVYDSTSMMKRINEMMQDMVRALIEYESNGSKFNK